MAAAVPENVDTRLTRAEERIRDHTEQLKVLWPLPAQYAVGEERHANLREDLNEGFKAIRAELAGIRAESRAELADLRADQKDRAKERRTMLVALFVAGVGLFGTFVATAVPLLKGPTPIEQEAGK